MVLIYIGNGKQYIHGIPAQNLNKHEIAELTANFYVNTERLSEDDFAKLLEIRGIYRIPKPENDND